MANIIQNFLGYLKLNDEDDLDDYDEYEEELNERRSRSERASREQQREERRAAKAARRKSRYEDDDDDMDDIPVTRTTVRSRSAREDSSRETPSRFSSGRSSYETASSRYEDTRAAARSRAEESVASRNGGASAASAAASQSAARPRTTRMERTATNKVVPIRTTSRGFEVCIIKPTTFEDAQDVCDMLLSNRAVILNLESIEQSEAQRIIDFVCGCVYAVNGKLHSVARYIFIFSPATVDISGDFAEFFQEAGFGVPKFSKDF